MSIEHTSTIICYASSGESDKPLAPRYKPHLRMILD